MTETLPRRTGRGVHRAWVPAVGALLRDHPVDVGTTAYGARRSARCRPRRPPPTGVPPRSRSRPCGTARAAGWIRTTQGDYLPAWLAAGGMCLAAALACLMAPRTPTGRGLPEPPVRTAP